MKRQSHRCIVIGKGSLPIRCTEILLGAEFEVLALVSNDAEVQNWGRTTGINCLSSASELVEQVTEPFDYLFSIVNDHILPNELLRRPKKLAINYHDAPLPRYAGTHATSWALMNGETIHGITWHIVTDVVDAGDILKQQSVEITKDDTALTLNTKCYEAAINSFAELVIDLSSGKAIGKSQNLAERTFFPRFKRPANGCVISWNNRAEEISALVRALNFGNHPNPLGVPKFVVENDFFIVSELEVLDAVPKSAPGTINEIGDNFLRISSADKEIVLRKILSLVGQPVSIGELVENFHLREGFQLPDLDAETAERIEENYKANCKDETYWAKKLSVLEPAVPPFTNNAAKSDSPRYENVRMPIPIEVLTFLEQPPKEPKGSDFVLAAFGALLARLGGVDSFDVGYSDPEINREIVGPEKLFTDQLPLRFNIDRQQNCAELLRSTKTKIQSIKNHQAYAYDIFARFPKLRSASETGNNFTLPVSVAKVERVDDYQPTNENELVLVISENEPACRFIHDRNRIDAENIDKLISHFTTFLKGIVDNPEGQIGYLPLLTEEERHQLLVAWNESYAEFPDQSIHHLFEVHASRNDIKTKYSQVECISQLIEAQVGRTPEATALIFGHERLTYQELNQRANRLANYIRNLDVGPEVIVGIYLERSVEMIVSILAVIKAGGAYVPLDPAYPQERIEYMLADSQARVLITSGKQVGGLSHYQGKVVLLDSDAKRIAQELDENPGPLTKPNNLAYVIYTSGSTGKPKGVAIEHHSTVALMYWANSVFNAEQLKGVLASTSICFDLSVYEMFVPLSCGGSIILVENVLHLATIPAANEVTIVNTVPSAITELLRINGVPPSVRTVNLAGEPLKTSLVRQIYDLGTVKEVFDLYGPTEDTTYSTFTLRNRDKATIGRPISNTQAYILDRYMQPVPVGIPGELYLGGDGLARGYLNLPELTNERFVKHPFSNDPTVRLYKTGDLVRYLQTGEIEYLGRIDNQVKIRGFRIELGEIETMLLGHPGISETVVIAREDSTGDKRLAAYFLSEQGQTVRASDLRDYLKQKLPDYMIPSAFVELDEMPLTPNGKIDRKGLPAPSPRTTEEQSGFVAHRDDLEAKLVKIWESILGIAPIGIHDNFFELGGHSLQAVRMFGEVEETFGKNIPLATLFEAGTIEKLAAILRQEGWAAQESSLVSIQPNGTRPPFFCVHAKGGNVLFYRDLAKHLGPDQPFYGIQARRLGGRQVGHATVEEMAEFYIKEIQTLQPKGPYYLGGSSFGGLAAFEIAQQLHRQGERIALLALLDTGTPDYPKMLPNTTAFRSKIYELIRRVEHHKDSLKAFNSKERADYVLDKLKKVKLRYRRKINNTYKTAVRKFYLRTKGVGSIPKNYIQIEDQIWKAGQKYLPKVYPGKMTLFRASNQPLGIQPDPTLGWESLVAGGIEIHEVPGHHGSVVAEPYVRVLAEKLNDCIESVHLKEKLFFEKPKSDEREKRAFAQAARVQSS